MAKRNISKVTQNSWHPGFLGAGHQASAVLDGIPYTDTDPFILFMDDVLDLPGGEPVGGAHPHAGFETLTLVLEGNEKGWETGSFEIMTAGKGIIHTEEITSKQKLRILQVWLVLPPEKRWIQPSFQKLLLNQVPSIKNDQYEIRVYSGSSNGLSSPIQNHSPFTLVDYHLNKFSSINQDIPSDYNGLIYVLEGFVKVGDQTIQKGQVAWISHLETNAIDHLTFQTDGESARFVLYAGRPHRVPVVQYGPFVGDSMEDIARLYKEYRNEQMPHLNEVIRQQKTIADSSVVD